MNLTSQVHTNNRWKKPRTDNVGSDGSTKIDSPSKEPGSCVPRLNTQEINTKKLNRPFTFKQIVRTACRRALNAFLGLFFFVVTRIPYFHFLKGTEGSQNPCLFHYWFWQKVLGLNRTAYWPVHFTSKINQSKNILVGIDSTLGYEPGCYIQGLGPVLVGPMLSATKSLIRTPGLTMVERVRWFRYTFGKHLARRRTVQDYSAAEKKGVDYVVELHDRCNGRPFKTAA